MMHWWKKLRLQARFMVLVGAGVLAIAMSILAGVSWFALSSIEQKLRLFSENELQSLNSLVESAMEHRLHDPEHIAITVFNHWFEHRNSVYPGKIWSAWGPKVTAYMAKTAPEQPPKAARDSIDQEVLRTGQPIARFVDGAYRYSLPIMLDKSATANKEVCNSCHTADMGINDGEVIAVFSSSVSTVEDFANLRHFLLLLAAGTAVAVVLVMLGIRLIFGRVITQPLTGITKAMRLLADGDKTIEVPAEDRADEIRDMAVAVRVFKDNMIEADRLRAEQKEAEVAAAVQHRVNEMLTRTAIVREREIADHKRAVRQAFDLLANVTTRASTAKSIEAVATICIEQICKTRRWQFGQVWYPDETADCLRCSAESAHGKREYADFHELSLATALRRDEGLPGQVLASKSSTWVPVIDRNVDPLRFDAAQRASCKASFAFPALFDGHVLAVFEFVSSEARLLEHPFLDAIDELALALGGILTRVQSQQQKQQAEDALRTAQAELSRAARLTTMGQLTATIAHEINQPLCAIVLNGNAGLRWLQRRPPDLGEVQETLKQIVSDGHRASETIASVRAIFKKDQGNRALIDINELIREVLALLKTEMETKRVAVQTELAHELPKLSAERVQLQQVILNLLMNAIEAMISVPEDGRTVTVRSSFRAPAEVVINVEDCGPGVDAKDIKRIFEPFFTTKGKGMGIGLSICRSIIETHHGRLSALPGAERGAVFEVILPAAAFQGA